MYVRILALPLCSPVFPEKNTVFPAFSQRGRPKTLSFSRFSAKGCRKPKPAKKPAGGIEPGTPVLWNVIKLPRGTWGTPPPPLPPPPPPPKIYVIDIGRGGGLGGGVILYPLVSIRHAEQCRRINVYIFKLLFLKQIFRIQFGL